MIGQTLVPDMLPISPGMLTVQKTSERIQEQTDSDSDPMDISSRGKHCWVGEHCLHILWGTLTMERQWNQHLSPSQVNSFLNNFPELIDLRQSR